MAEIDVRLPESSSVTVIVRSRLALARVYPVTAASSSVVAMASAIVLKSWIDDVEGTVPLNTIMRRSGVVEPVAHALLSSV